jgi:O-6-methylguanine DNA methyltransferase
MTRLSAVDIDSKESLNKTKRRQERGRQSVTLTKTQSDSGSGCVHHGPTRTPTAFQCKVYAVLKKYVLTGSITTYGQIAKAIGSSPRAVGNALRNNPYAPIVPCHRVIKSDKTIGGFHGSTGNSPEVRRKIKMVRGMHA